MKIVVLDFKTIGPNIKLIRPDFEHELVIHELTEPEQIEERIKDADICVLNKLKISGEVLRKAPKLKLIAIMATGLDVIDMEACKELDIKVCNVRNYGDSVISEHILACIFALRRHLFGHQQEVINKNWSKSKMCTIYPYPMDQIKGSRLGIIGAGFLGGNLGEMANAIGLDVYYSLRKGQSDESLVVKEGKKYMPFEKLISTSDIISINCPLTPETLNLIGKSELEAMKNSAILINTARGKVVNENDLIDAILNDTIAGAAVDVFSEEPIPEDSPYFKIIGRENFIATPHIAWCSLQTRNRVWEQMIENLNAFHEGKR